MTINHSEITSSARRVLIRVDGKPIEAWEGQTVAAALWSAGRRQLRRTSRFEQPRGVFCGMGVCFDCLMQINGRPNVQACRIEVEDAMDVRTQQGPGTWGEAS